MLTHIHIRDLVLVESLELAFAGGLTVLTGETGAGKSIVVDALTLVAGNRADATMVRAGAEKAEVSASFEVEHLPPALRAMLEDAEIQVEGELLLRRVIGADGRSRAFVNGQPVPLQQLREIAAFLLDVHGQHEFQSLVRSTAQRELVDTYGRLQPRVAEVVDAHGRWHRIQQQLQQMEATLRDRDARLDLLRFQESELAALDLKPGEAEELAVEALRLGNRGRLLEGAQLAAQLLYEGEQDTAQARLARALAALRPLLEVDAGLASIVPLLDEAAIRVTEAARELSRYADALDMDTSRQAAVEKRLAAAEELGRRHRVPPADLPAHREALRAELGTLESASSDAALLQQQRDDALSAWRRLAIELSEARISAAETFGKEISARMQQLGMAGGRFEVAVSVTPDAPPSPQGIDTIEFLVTANPGQPLRPLARVASGGELARLSLAVQVACVADEKRCLVFDEVDAGIGGAIAEIVGRQLRSLGVRGQVLCVTHLPQVAAQGNQQLRVAKSTTGGQTRTYVSRLAAADRVQEIARMLGGTAVTAKGTAHAEEMLRAAGNPEGDTVRIKRPRTRSVQP